MSYCSPDKTKNSVVCFSNRALMKIATEYNKGTVPCPHNKGGKRIKIPKNKNLSNKDRQKLWNKIQIAMIRFTPCKSDFCLLETPLFKKIKDTEIQNDTFRPKMPKEWNNDMTTWLSTLDIEAVMKQYENKHQDFIFIGPVPIDFDYKIGFGHCISNELCKINLKKIYKQGIRKIGVIFNLDPHYMNGSHWVALFVDMNKGGVYFFDSYGYKPNKEIHMLMERIRKQGNSMITKNIIKNMNNEHKEVHNYKKINKHTIKVKNTTSFIPGNLIYFTKSNTKKINPKTLNIITNVKGKKIKLLLPINCNTCKKVIIHSFRMFYNNNRFQYKGSECGVYSMHFIEEFLNGKNFNEIINNVYNDDEINKKRKLYYRPNIRTPTNNKNNEE